VCVLREAVLDEHRQGEDDAAVAGSRDDSSLRRVALDLGPRPENLAGAGGETIEQLVVPRRRSELLHRGLGLPAKVVVDRPLRLEHESSCPAPGLREGGDRLEVSSGLALRPRAGDPGFGLLMSSPDLIGRAFLGLSHDVVGGRPRIGEERLANRVEA
jgi:hypothetical protein